jgi:hypothetical protein
MDAVLQADGADVTSGGTGRRAGASGGGAGIAGVRTPRCGSNATVAPGH